MGKQSQQQEKKGLVPKLRFAEFRESGEWGIGELKEACHMQAGKFVKATDIFEQPAEDLFPCYGGNGLRGYTKTYTHEGNFSLIGRQGALCGNITLAKETFHATEHAVVCNPKNKFTTDWLYYKLIHLNLNQYATGQAQPGLSIMNLERVTINFPTIKKEQQKIAHCLSAIDELISAQSQKVETLKAHKKGLMQQLFPAEGETVPKLRFAEFRESGEWGENKIEDICEKPFSGSTPTTSNKQYYGGKIPFIRSAEIDATKTELFLTEKGLVNSSAKLVKTGDVLIALYGANSGDVAIGKIDGAINQAVLCLRSKESNTFLYQYLNHKKKEIISRYLQGGQGNLSGDIIKSVDIFAPKPKEQKKIAHCLSAIDELISAQSQKVQALKAHKKGLMQQLFPTVDD